MADTTNNREENREYKGPGRVTSAVGRAYLQYLAGAAVVGGIILAASKNARGAVSALGTMMKASFNPAAAKEAEVLLSGETGVDVIKGLGLLSGGAVTGGIVAGAHGAYKGWQNASAAKEQVEALNTQLDAAQNDAQQSKSFVAALNAEKQKAAAAIPTIGK